VCVTVLLQAECADHPSVHITLPVFGMPKTATGQQLLCSVVMLTVHALQHHLLSSAACVEMMRATCAASHNAPTLPPSTSSPVLQVQLVRLVVLH
jgi:hypothetical protein